MSFILHDGVIMSDFFGDFGPPSSSISATRHSPTRDASTSTIAIAMLFGTVLFTTASITARLWLVGLWTWKDGGRPIGTCHRTSDNFPLDITSLPSVYNLLHYSSILGLILLYSYVCENHPPYPHDEKSYDRDRFLLWTVLVVGIAGGQSWKKNDCIDTNQHRESSDFLLKDNAHKKRDIGNDNAHQFTLRDTSSSNHSVLALPKFSSDNEVLNRYQTTEWKGWMQLVFLVYHYMHATEFFTCARIMNTAYAWMTGFANCSFFLKNKDYSLPRILHMLWRLNFLALFLCCTHGNPYILYYICPLHTFYFLMVFVIMSISKEKNYSKWWIRSKLGASAFIIYIIWDYDSGIFEIIHRLFLGYRPIIGAPLGSMWEWYFRLFLDHWSNILGMIFAINLPIVSLIYRKIEARSFFRQCLGKSAVVVAMLISLGLWIKGPVLMEEEQYNRTNPYFGFIPLLTYIYVRNLTPHLRSHSMAFPYAIGKITLEIYLMQHHILLTSNSKTVLVLVAGFPRVNMAVVSCLLIMICKKLNELTGRLRDALLPDDPAFCIRSMVSFAAILSGFYFTALILDGIEVISLGVIGVVSVVCGGLLYQTVIDFTWNKYHNALKASKEENDQDLDCISMTDRTDKSYLSVGDVSDDSIITKVCPPVIGIMFLFVLGSIWNELAITGASSVGRLPPHCHAFANDGDWFPVDGCSKSELGLAYRQYGVTSFGTCAPHVTSYFWTWKKQPSYTNCRFGYRGEAKLKRLLNRNYVVFIGDSMIRNLYHASLRTMGIEGSGRYDATIPKHTDLVKLVWGTTPINFKWAPLAVDQLNVLKEINELSSNGADLPDLIVLGGGAWDRLHVYASDEDRQSHASTLKKLSVEMKKAQRQIGAAVVWVVPTTINNQALNTEEKRDHMREEDMEVMRAEYERNEILSSSSFVLDGRSFTASRVSESFDGVHYPHQVYDAGAQILFQSFDWLLIDKGMEDPVDSEVIGKLSNPKFGMMMLALVAIGLIYFDGFLGFSYFSALFVKGVRPADMQEESTSKLYKKRPNKNDKQRTDKLHVRNKSTAKGRSKNVQEMARLLESNRTSQHDILTQLKT